MATFCGQTVFTPSHANMTSGGVFRLSRTPDSPVMQHLPGGATVSLLPGFPYVIATVPATTSQADALSRAIRVAQQGLDLASIQGPGDFWLPEVQDWHITWWQGPAGVNMRFTEVSSFGITMKADLTAFDSMGRQKPDPPKPQHAWDESFPYFRLAQTTEDLFDAYRNMYLGLESLLYSIEPIQLNSSGKQGESEKAWFIRAVRKVGLPSMTEFAPPSIANPNEEDVYNDLYKDMRTALFHSKRTWAHYIPHEPLDRGKVRQSYARLTKLYLAIVQSWLQITRRSGAVTEAGFQELTKSMDDTPAMYVSPDFTPENQLENRFFSAPFALLPTRRAKELDGQFIKYVVGTDSSSNLATLSGIRQIVLFVDSDIPLLASTLEGLLTLDGVAQFEAHLPLRMKQPQQPKQFYSG